MENSLIPVFSAIWFGILTSISPCPLATNIIATTYIGKQIKDSYGTLIAGFFYTIGRAFAYVVISFIIVFSLLSVPEISFFLQENMNKILGPLLQREISKKPRSRQYCRRMYSRIHFCAFLLSDICCVVFREHYSPFIEI